MNTDTDVAVQRVVTGDIASDPRSGSRNYLTWRFQHLIQTRTT